MKFLPLVIIETVVSSYFFRSKSQAEVKDDIFPAIVQECFLYCYATAKASVKLISQSIYC